MKMVAFRFILASLLTTIVVFAPTAIEAKTFENDKYTFEFPSGCKLEKTENRFSSKDASLECSGDAGFSFESGIDSFASSSDSFIVTGLQTVMESAYENVDIVESGTDKYTINNMTAPYVIGTYDQSFTNAFGLSRAEPWVLMTILIKLDDNDDMILGQYRNTEDDFDKKLPMAEKIFQSVKPLAGSTSASSTVLTSSSSDPSSNENKLAQMQTTIECGKILFDELGEKDATIDVDTKSAVFANGTSMTCKDLEEIKK